MTTPTIETLSDNIVVAIAHDILRLRGKDATNCTQAELISAYERAERAAESMVKVAQRIAARAAREAA